MGQFPNLKNAPSVEAVLELRVRLSAPFSAEKAAKFGERMKSAFPKSADLRFVAATVSFGDEAGVAPSSTVSQIGVRLESEDGKSVVQAKADGLALSRLAPYQSWESLIAQLQGVWPAYVDTFAPQVVTRIGVRFINKIILGTGPVDLDDLLVAGPKIPNGLPQSFIQFSSNVVVPMSDQRAAVSISQASEIVPSGPGMGFNVILDIDAFSEEPHDTNDSGVWNRLEDLRTIKNMAFFGSIKPETLARFQ